MQKQSISRPITGPRPSVVDLPAAAFPRPLDRSRRPWKISAAILMLFWGALLFEFWPDVAAAVMRVVNSARSVGSEPVESRVFEVLNNSNAPESQVEEAVRTLEIQYQAISSYLGLEPEDKIPLLIVNGQSVAVMDGEQIVIQDNNGILDADLVPLYLVFLIEDLPVNTEDGLAAAGGHALQIIEAAGLNAYLTRQPLDDWTALLGQSGKYVPLEEAWQEGIPNDEDAAVRLMVAMLESGSFMKWVVDRHGMDAARRLAMGEPFEDLTGQPLSDAEREWLADLDARPLSPQPCAEVVPADSIFQLMCGQMQ